MKQFDAALVRTFASRQNVGALATFLVTFAIAFVVWPHVPSAILILWTATQIFIALFSMMRWNRFRYIDASLPYVSALKKEAVVLKAAAGALWGVLAVFSSLYLPQSLEFFTAIAVAAVAIGGVSTMAAISSALYAFIILSFGPFIIFWLMGNDAASVTLGLLSILLLGVIINSARIAHGQLVSVQQSEFDLRALKGEFEVARGEWLDLSDTTESYVVFDPQDRLVAWNKRFAELMKVPPEMLHRGTPRAEIIKRARQPVEVASGDVSLDQWLQRRIGATKSNQDASAVTEFAGGLWIQRRETYSENGNLVLSHVDLTDMVKAEMALSESEERYRSIAENSPDAIFVRVGEEIVFANPAAVNLLGAESEADLIGLTLMSLYHPGDHGAILNNRTKLAQQPDKSPPLVRARMRRVDGTYVMTEGSGTNHTWQGQPAVMAIRRDITAQMDADERLRESEQRYRRIADLSPIAILIRVGDLIVYANPAAIKMFGAESEADLLYESTIDLVHPDDQHIVEQNRAKMTPEMEGAAPSIQVRRRRFDGSYFRCEGSGAPFVWQAQPAVMLMWRDVTVEAEASHRVHESEEQLRAIVENMPGSIVLKDTNLRIRLAAGRDYGHWAGISSADVIGKTAEDLVPKDLAAKLESKDREILKTGEVVEVEIDTKTASGDDRTFISTRFPVIDAAGTTIGIGIINHDITEQRRTEAQLRRTLDTVGSEPTYSDD